MQQRWLERMWIVRHGESAGNVAHNAAHAAGLPWIEIEARDADVPLSARGEHQADALAHWFASADEAEQPDIILTSPYVRARQTAERICGAARTSPMLVVDERLREKELGILDRLTHAGLGQLQPQQAELRRRLGKFYYRPPGGESWCDVILRLRSALDTISLHHSGRRVLIVCHQVVVLCLRYLLENLDEQKLLAIDAAGDVANCSITEYGFEPDAGQTGGMLLSRYNFLVPLEQEAVPITTAPDAKIAAR
jgi:probable phosphoglycerate mutase